MRILRWAAVIAGALLLVIQVVRPAKSNPAVDERKTIQVSTALPTAVGAILDRSCNDCHSSKTLWPWYSNIAPASWYLVYDVNKGRKELSFSDWGSYNTRRTAKKLQEICEQLEKGKMPTKAYVLLHPTARLSEADKRLLCDWAKQGRARVLGAQASKRR